MKIGTVIGAHLPSMVYENLLINRCLPSLSKQTRIPDELVVVINGYYDFANIKNLVKKIQKSYSHSLKIVATQKKLGCGPARNLGVKNLDSKIEYFTLLDVDDEYIENKIELQEKYLKESKNNVDVLGTLFYVQDNLSRKISEKKEDAYDSFEKIKEVIKRDGNPMCGASCMIKKESFEKLGGFEERYVPGHVWPNYNRPMWEDYDMWLRFVKNGFRLENISEHLYIVHLGNHVSREF